MGASRPGRLAPLLLAGAALALTEAVLVVALEHRLFLSLNELARYVRLAVSVLACTTLALGLVGGFVFERLASSPRRLAVAITLAVGSAFSAVGWLLTAGRRVRDLPGRAVIVIALGLFAGWLAARAVVLLRRQAAEGRERRVLVACALFGTVALAVDMLVLRRLYPAFHWTLAGLAAAAAAVAAAYVRAPRWAATRQRHVAAAAALCAVWAAAEVASVRDAPNARFAIDQAAPLTGKLLALVPAPRRLQPPPAASATATGAAEGPLGVGIDLRGTDVLLISIDALRADRVAAPDGRAGPAPALDRLARESAVFDRAYTPTPHTSYALASTMTSKYLRPLMALSGELPDHPTLARLLRRHGYRTAAFYPPAVFFVDEQRFASLASERFGFEYTKAMFAPAEQRVAQLEEYLAAASSEHPLFVWVHLFEPHEPYEPPERFARGETPVERYDGEVACADDAVGKLVRVFRAARPGSTVIVTADHGEEFGEHGGGHHGTTLFDEQVRVPLLWSSPGVVTPRRIAAPVETIDIGTTLLSALGIPRDVRMRGDDLTPLLAGGEAPASMRAFASLDDLHMVTDGRLKAVCGHAGGSCRLFDLVADPGERRDLAHERPTELATLVAELSKFHASIPHFEALAMEQGGGWPEALARATLGDATAAPALVPLLSSPRAEVRRAAARAVGELGHAPARPALARLRDQDPDREVRGEAAVAGLVLGDVDAAASLRALLGDAALTPELSRRAALALAAEGDASGRSVLRAHAADSESEEAGRVAAIAALGRVGDADDVEPLAELLDDVRLRPHVARALGALDEPGAIPHLRRAFERERYPEARSAEARALLALGQGALAAKLVERFLGTESSLPDGVGLLIEADRLRGRGARLVTDPAVRVGVWTCEADACRPGEGAGLRLGARHGRKRVRLTLRVRAGADATITLGAAAHELPVGESEVALAVEPARGPGVVPVTGHGDLQVLAYAVVPVRPDIPPPPPEPWGPDAGAGDAPQAASAPAGAIQPLR